MREGELLKETELELSARLLRALAHRMRGDLSVVTNDLAFLASLVGPGEVDRSRARCAAMVGVLSTIGSLPIPVLRAACTLKELVSPLRLAPADKAFSEIIVCADLNAVEYTSQLLRHLLGDWSGFVSCEESDLAVVCELRFQQSRDFLQSYGSVGRMAAAELGERFVVEGCLADLILRDHGWKITLSCSCSQVLIRIEIPLAEDKKAA